jgi:inner membrane protein
MAGAVGHILGAVAVWEATKRVSTENVPRGSGWYLLPVAISLAPDLDVIAIALGAPVVHRGPSHSILAALILAVIGALIIGLRLSFGKAVRSFIFVFACAAVHPLLDYLMGRGPVVHLLWPWNSAGYLSPVQLIPTAYSAKTLRGTISALLSVRTAKGVLLEVLSIGPLWLAARSRQREIFSFSLLVSCMGFALTWMLYH